MTEAAAPGIRPRGNGQHNGTTDPGLELVATQDCHKTTKATNGGVIYGRMPHYSLRDPSALSQAIQCNPQQPQTGQNRCYTVFEYIPEADQFCTIGGAKEVSPCEYFDGTASQPNNEFDDEIARFQPGQSLKTQYFDYGRPGERMWNVYRIYRTLSDRSLQSKQPSPACQYCYQKNLLNIVYEADPLIDGYLDPWLAPWDGTDASCHDEGSVWFQ
jgi:hypothetical protein